jgi:hypothetical protein
MLHTISNSFEGAESAVSIITSRKSKDNCTRCFQLNINNYIKLFQKFVFAGRRGLSSARLTRNVRPSFCEPSREAIAFSASSFA